MTEEKFASMELTRSEAVELLSTRETFRTIAGLFTDYCNHYQKRPSWFYKGRMFSSPKARAKSEEQMRRLILLVVALETEIEIFMKAQFEMLVPYFSVRKIPVTFAMMITDKAIDRFLRYKDRIKAQFKLESDRDREFYKVPKKDLVTAIFNSGEAYHSVLIKQQERLGRLPTPEEALEILEVLAKAGMVTRLYVATSPLLRQVEGWSIFLTKHISATWGTLTKEESYELQRVRDELSKAVESSEVGKYV